MERIQEVDINNPEEYKRIWEERMNKDIDVFDMKRWKLLLKYFHGGKLIDLGCLDSEVPLMAKKKFPKAEIWALDFVKEVIDSYKEVYPEIMYVVGDVYKTTFPSNYFDYVVLGEVIEHLERPTDAIYEAFRILKKGGILALSTPLEEIKELGAKDKDRHLWSFNKEDIEEMLGVYGTVKIKIMKSQYLPIYKYNFPNIIAYGRKS